MPEYNQTICDFLGKNGIDITNIPNELNKLVNSSSRETILSNFLYSVYKPRVRETVSIANISGSSVVDLRHSRNSRIHLLDLFNDFFDRNGDGYYSRSVELLDYNETEILDKLRQSIEEDPIYFIAIQNKYYVSTNGNHRSFVLLFHYLNSVSKSPEKEEELKEKFQIKGTVEHLDLELSGMVFMLKQKYGERIRINEALKDNEFSISIDEITYPMTVSEFKEFAQKELSRTTCDFRTFRTFVTVAMKNASRDIHFRTAMNYIYEGFLKMDLDKLSKILLYSEGLEDSLSEIPFQNISFIEYIEKIKQTILEIKLEEITKTIEVEKIRERNLERLKKEKSELEGELEELGKNARNRIPYDYALMRFESQKISGIDDSKLEEEEQIVTEQLSALQEKKWPFRNKRKIEYLESRLKELKKILDEDVYFEYDGKSYTLREFLRMVKESKNIPKVDFYEKQNEISMRIFDIDLEMIELNHQANLYYDLRSFKILCENFKVNFEEVIKNYQFKKEIEEVLDRGRKVVCPKNF